MAPAGDREGYWGPTTSTLDWCEENYAVTLFVAEFWRSAFAGILEDSFLSDGNTVSNLIMIIPPIFGAVQSIRDGLEKRYIAAYLALTVVGMGSWCFHMTLKYEMQVMYGMLVFTLVLRSIYIVTWVYPWLRGLGYTSLTVFLLGFLLWNVDNIFCDSLRNFRKRAPPILGVTTQFHAWWHILTGLGSYLHILFR
ncbi:Alkaline ceramidase 3 [Microtus ochrogaster]|uniref:Alkaline ceramidase n=1 Tax=Microtus ochrogaster TaxID=79684 RepID=A0A8J6FY32_MICOH|nr:Alkaline ceramidase 3 [Microtus ochrogaster]